MPQIESLRQEHWSINKAEVLKQLEGQILLPLSETHAVRQTNYS